MQDIDFQLQSFWEKIWNMITIEFIVKFLIVYFFIVWIALVIWVIKDISIRTNSILFQIFSVLIVLIWTPLWIFIYLIIRPRRTLYDKYYQEIEDNLEIISELVEERKKQIEASFKKNEIKKVELTQKTTVAKIITKK